MKMKKNDFCFSDSSVKYLLHICLLFFIAVILESCSKEKEPLHLPSDRVVLLYMAGDNNLAGYVQGNLDGMARGMASAPGGARTLVYLDTPGQNPRLAEVTISGIKELYVWSGPHDSASAGTLREVIDRVRTLAPAGSYGLVLWSHGMGWTPSSATDYFVRSVLRSMQRWPATKYFGQDTGENPCGYIETEELVAAIPAGVFDYIIFDACFMASAELLYELRDKTEWIVASPAEVIADGFPYEKVMAELLRTDPDLRFVCETYYRHYADHADPAYHAATVALIRTAELEALADVTASLLSTALAADPEALAGMELGQVQPLDRYRRHFLFDAGSVMGRLENLGLVPASRVAAWREQLARTVPYEAHTSQMLGLVLDECCGLSVYVPYGDYTDLNEYYKTLGWYARCYPADFRSCDE